jgi:hypothetical protein
VISSAVLGFLIRFNARRICSSRRRFAFRWLELRFLKGEQGILFELPKLAPPQPQGGGVVKALGQVVGLGDAPACQFCGSLMVRNGSCYRCMECGSTSGCS